MTENNRYYVTFNGELNFSDENSIKDKLAQDYKKRNSAFDNWFTGETILLKKSVSNEEAKEIAAYFEKIGMVINIHSMDIYSLTDEQLLKTDTSLLNLNAETLLKAAGYIARLGASIIDLLVIIFCASLINTFLSFFKLDFFSQLGEENTIFVINYFDNVNRGIEIDEDQVNTVVSAARNTYLFYSFTLVNIFYYALMHISSYQATLGKIVFGLIVCDKNGNSLTLMKSLIRSIVLVAPIHILNVIIQIGLLAMFLTKRRQALHDKFVDSYVVYKNKKLNNNNNNNRTTI